MPGTLNQGDSEEGQDDSEQEVELTDGFTFVVTKDEADKLGVAGRKESDECKFIVTALVTKVGKDGGLTFKASEIEWVYDENAAPAEPNDMVGASPMYKSGFAKPKPTKVQYTRPTMEPYVS